MTDVGVVLKQQLLHVAVGKQKAVVEVYRVGDDGLREAVAFGPFTRLGHRASLPDVKQVDTTLRSYPFAAWTRAARTCLAAPRL